MRLRRPAAGRGGRRTGPGIHGWYWINVGDVPMVVRLSVGGRYELLLGSPVRVPMGR